MGVPKTRFDVYREYCVLLGQCGLKDRRMMDPQTAEIIEAVERLKKQCEDAKPAPLGISPMAQALAALST